MSNPVEHETGGTRRTGKDAHAHGVGVYDKPEDAGGTAAPDRVETYDRSRGAGRWGTSSTWIAIAVAIIVILLLIWIF